MAAFILATKLFAPPLRSGWILRQRLVEQLNTSSQRKLTLVSAPAGYGKTTWGMTPDEVVSAETPKAEKPEKPETESENKD